MPLRMCTLLHLRCVHATYATPSSTPSRGWPWSPCMRTHAGTAARTRMPSPPTTSNVGGQAGARQRPHEPARPRPPRRRPARTRALPGAHPPPHPLVAHTHPPARRPARGVAAVDGRPAHLAPPSVLPERRRRRCRPGWPAPRPDHVEPGEDTPSHAFGDDCLQDAVGRDHARGGAQDVDEQDDQRRRQPHHQPEGDIPDAADDI